MQSILNSTLHLLQILLFVLFKQQNFTKTGEQEAARCDTVTFLINRGCSPNSIINPKNDIQMVLNKPLATGPDPVQIQPQEIHLNLRPGMLYTYKLLY